MVLGTIFFKMILPLKQLESKVFKSFSASKCFILLELIALLMLFSLLSKSAFVTKFACANIAVETPADKLLNSGVVMYLS